MGVILSDEVKSESFLKFLREFEVLDARDSSLTDGVDFQGQVEQAARKLQHSIVQYHPLGLLSRLAYENLFCAADGRPLDAHRLVQFHIEVLQAFVAASKEEWWQAAPKVVPTYDVARDLANLVTAVAMKQLQIAEVRKAEDASPGNDEPTQMVSGAACNNPEQLLNKVNELFASKDQAIQKERGFSPIQLAKMLSNLVLILETRIRELENDELFPVLNAKYLADIKLSRVKSTDVQFQLAALRKRAQKERWLIDKLKFQFREWWLFRLSEQFLFSIDEIKFAYGSDVEVDVLEKIVASWSLPMGDVGVAGVEALIIANPIWEKPFFKIGEGKYALFVPKILFENGWQLVSNSVLNSEAGPSHSL